MEVRENVRSSLAHVIQPHLCFATPHQAGAAKRAPVQALCIHTTSSSPWGGICSGPKQESWEAQRTSPGLSSRLINSWRQLQQQPEHPAIVLVTWCDTLILIPLLAAAGISCFLLSIHFPGENKGFRMKPSLYFYSLCGINMLCSMPRASKGFSTLLITTRIVYINADKLARGAYVCSEILCQRNQASMEMQQRNTKEETQPALSHKNTG